MDHIFSLLVLGVFHTSRLGASRVDAVEIVDAGQFQFSLNLSAGCSLLQLGVKFLVSILTQPLGWVQLQDAKAIIQRYVREFQSSPNLSAGCSWAMEAFQRLR